MALAIATNTGALMAAASATSVNKDMQTSMERLSTGKRINSAANDAAGTAIASRLSSEIRGTNQAIRNAMDGQALIDTAEGAHKEVENILQRMRELAFQAANDTNDTGDRENLDAEFQQLIIEIDRIAEVTTWAGQDLLSGTTTNDFTFQIGQAVGGGNAIAIKIGGLETDGGTILGAIDGLDLKERADATAAITAIDTSIKNLNAQRADLGAVSNRLDNTVSNLNNIVIQLEGGKGRIEDADFAAESTSLAKSQILQQASTAMLAQANASKQNVLSLLQG
jgi:flagellin